MKVFKTNHLWVLVLILAWCFPWAIACGDDDDDPSASSGQADNDANDDLDDDADDDFDDDSDDDADDDTAECVDGDGDNYGENCAAGPDCNDENVDVWQWLDGYTDEDGDGYGGGDAAQVCSGDSLPEGYYAEAEDCNNANFLINPTAPELPDDGIDQDCDDVDLIPGNDTGIFVAKSGDDANPGSMAAPILTINAGVELALTEGKSVFVATGEYSEDVETQVSLFGGYESAGWTRDIEANETIISAAISTALILGEPETVENGGEVNTTANETNFITIQGFTINSKIEGDLYGGVINYNTVFLADNTINGTMLGQQGTAILLSNKINGGAGDFSYSIFFLEGEAVLINNLIKAGTSENESIGVSNYYCKMTLIANEIDGGSGKDSMGLANYSDRFFENYGTVILINNIISGGTGQNSSVGISNDGIAILVNNTIYAGMNTSESIGVTHLGLSTTLVNNTIDGGSGTNMSAAILLYETFTPEVSLINNNIWSQDQQYLLSDWFNTYITDINELDACSWVGCNETSSNISADPLFVNSEYGDFHLLSASPCIDNGTDPGEYVDSYLTAFDFDGDPRPFGAGWDIGPDEWTGQ